MYPGGTPTPVRMIAYSREGHGSIDIPGHFKMIQLARGRNWVFIKELYVEAEEQIMIIVLSSAFFVEKGDYLHMIFESPMGLEIHLEKDQTIQGGTPLLDWWTWAQEFKVKIYDGFMVSTGGLDELCELTGLHVDSVKLEGGTHNFTQLVYVPGYADFKIQSGKEISEFGGEGLVVYVSTGTLVISVSIKEKKTLWTSRTK